ncbi:MAG: hypothetical protein U9N14_03240 [Pseudomonadota bacterium]|nr:hypothetical protein [Pseudomonadota bacterium]
MTDDLSQNKIWQERKYLDMDEFKEWAAEHHSSLIGAKRIYSKVWT